MASAGFYSESANLLHLAARPMSHKHHAHDADHPREPRQEQRDPIADYQEWAEPGAAVVIGTIWPLFR